MATLRIPILGATTIPDSSGKVWAEPYSILATNDQWPHMIFRYDEDGTNATALTTKAGIYGSFDVPKNYVGSAAIIIIWTSTITTGNVVWDFDYRTVAGNDAASLDQSGTEEAVTGTDAAPTAAHRRLEFSLSLTSSNLAVDDTVQFALSNDGVDAADTLAGARLLAGAYLQYVDA